MFRERFALVVQASRLQNWNASREHSVSHNSTTIVVAVIRTAVGSSAIQSMRVICPQRGTNFAPSSRTTSVEMMSVQELSW